MHETAGDVIVAWSKTRRRSIPADMNLITASVFLMKYVAN